MSKRIVIAEKTTHINHFNVNYTNGEPIDFEGSMINFIHKRHISYLKKKYKVIYKNYPRKVIVTNI